MISKLMKLNNKLILLFLIVLMILPGFIFTPKVLGNKESYSNISVEDAYKMIKKQSNLILLM